MATTHGNSGAVYVGANQVLEVNAWSYDESSEQAEDSAMGDANKTYLSGQVDGGGSITCHWDPDDATGQELLIAGASVTVTLYPEGNTTGNEQYSGTVNIESVGISGEKSGIVGRTFSFKGVLAAAAVP